MAPARAPRAASRFICRPRAANGFLPDLDALDDATLARTVAFYIASPANPQGAVASRDYFARLKQLADRFGFFILSDECYSEIYTKQAPGSMLEAAGPDFTNVVAFQSLSKRSNLPGMRVGFAAGDKKFLGAFHELRNVAAPQVPVPLQQVAVAAYSDEAHVEENRRLYRMKFDLADQILGNRYGYHRPAGGFCVWLDVSALGGDEAVTVKLYKDAGVRVLPGSYLARQQADGSNPGDGYIRLALVQDSETISRSVAPAGADARSVAGPHEHAGDRTRHSPCRPVAGVDPRGVGAAVARTRGPRIAQPVRRRGGGADDLVGAGPEPQPRHLAIDPQHRRLSRRDRRRSFDADSRPRRHHADPAGRDLGLAHADPPHLRPRSAAHRVLDSLHRDRGGFCQLLAAWRFLAAADRARRRGRRRAGARARGGVRPARHSSIGWCSVSSCLRR